MKRLAFVLILLLAATGMVLQSGSLPHLHAARDSGLYNQEHDLTLLAARGSGAPLPSAPALATALVVVAVAHAAVLSLPWRPAGCFAARAPPASS